MIKLKLKPAFTMIELVFVIVVMGIVISIAIPKLSEDKSQEAADAILSDIRYTQHLALLDDKHNFANNRWQRSFWRIGFQNCASGSGLFEYIGSDTDYGRNISNDEAATDPANGKKMNWANSSNCSNGGNASTSDRIFITKKYGITSVDWTGSCSASKYIGFDHLGRPHQRFTTSKTPYYSSYLTSLCTITFTMSGSTTTFAIDIAPETGYAHIVGQDDS
jgi:prepilin-type N-terminal cleavage/methylation domain-containing protein